MSKYETSDKYAKFVNVKFATMLGVTTAISQRCSVIHLFKSIIEYYQYVKSQQRVVQLVRVELEMFLEIL